MRMILVFAAWMPIIVASAVGQDAPASPATQDQTVTPAAAVITDTMIIESCGDSLAKMFSRFGTPSGLTPARGDKPENDDVFCDYLAYGFRVHNNVIHMCFFWPGWKGTIKGIKFGDTRDDVVKVLGKPLITKTDKNGVITDYGYNLKDLGSQLWPSFDASGKLTRVEVILVK